MKMIQLAATSLNRFPKRGDRLKTGNIEFIIEHATKARIVSIIMKIKQS
jgi:CBS domain containing-hemolysin-like protein